MGGPVSKLAELRIIKKSTHAREVFPLKGSSHGAAVNIEGDVAAFVIASGSPVDGVIPRIDTEVERGLAGALIDYLGPNDMTETWRNRARLFLRFYGGKFNDDNELVNQDQIVKLFEPKIRKFAVYYKETRLKDEAYRRAKDEGIEVNEEVIEAYMAAIEALIPEASMDTARMFVEILAKGVKYPESTLTP